MGAHLDEHWTAWFDGFALTRHDDGSTTLHGTVTDQAELHGLLAKVRDLGVPLISVTPIERRTTTPTQIPSNGNIAVPQAPKRGT